MKPTNKEMFNYYLEEGYKAKERADIERGNMFYNHAKTTLTELLQENLPGKYAKYNLIKKFGRFANQHQDLEKEKDILVLTKEYRILEPKEIGMIPYNPINKSFIEELKKYEKRKASKTQKAPTKKNQTSQKTIEQTKKLLQYQNANEINSHISELKKEQSISEIGNQDSTWDLKNWHNYAVKTTKTATKNYQSFNRNQFQDPNNFLMSLTSILGIGLTGIITYPCAFLENIAKDIIQPKKL